MSLRLGVRNLLRNRWRTGLTLAAVALAVALMVWMLSMYEGWLTTMVRGATAVELGEAQVHAAEYVDQPRVYEAFDYDPALLDRVLAVDGVRAAAPRVEAFGLVGDESRSQVARVVGVDPRLEAEATPIVDAIVDGRWLGAEPAASGDAREAVLGADLARQLRAEPGDEVVVFGEAADGSLGNDRLRVVGVVRTANMEVDRLAVYMHLEDAQFLAALDGRVHELAIRTESLDAASETAAAVAAALEARTGGATLDESVRGGAVRAEGVPDAAGGALVVRSWQELAPNIHQMILMFRSSYVFMYLIAYLVAAVGILNTARMSAIERRREFGVMMAIGMRPRRMFRTLAAETVVLGLVGAVIGAIGGTMLSAYFTTAGLDLTLFTDEASFSFMGVAFSERLYFILRARHVIEPVAVMLVVALLSGLWPALKAARIDPAPTIAGRT